MLLLHLSLNRQSVKKLLSYIKENIMTTNPYKIEYQNLLKELIEDRDDSLELLKEGNDFKTFTELKKEVYILNSIIARMESFLSEEL